MLDLAATGLTNAEIAAKLYLSPHTVKNHKATIMYKTGSRSLVEAIHLLVIVPLQIENARLRSVLDAA